MGTLKVPHQVGDLGGYLKEQRESARLSLRQLATAAGVSNPYLSQIERGMRRPSAEVLQQIAKGLQISAEALFLRAGLLEASGGLDVEVAVHSDIQLTARQKRVLLDIYATFRAENARSGAESDVEAETGGLKSDVLNVDGAGEDADVAAPAPTSRKRAAAKPAKTVRTAKTANTSKQGASTAAAAKTSKTAKAAAGTRTVGARTVGTRTVGTRAVKSAASRSRTTPTT